MTKSFHFVDGLQNDRDAKRLKRRWVMMGKNVGKTHARRSRVHRRQTNATRPMLYSSAVNTFRTQLIPFPLPWEVQPATLKCIHEFFTVTADRLYPLQLGISMHQAKLMWLGFLFTDEAAFYCNVALMEACNEILWSDGQTPPQALYNISQTLTQVQKRLEGDKALSDPTMGIILSLIHQEHIRRQHDDAAVHMRGLEKIVELRGGLNRLEGNTWLTLKICKIDIMLALQHGGPTAFFRDRLSEVLESLESEGVCVRCPTTAPSAPQIQVHPYLMTILLDVKSICLLFNKHLDTFTLDIRMLQEITASVCYRLLRFRTLGDTSHRPDVNAAYHVGLTAFMMTMFLQSDHRRIVGYDLIMLHLKQILVSSIDKLDDQLALWLAVVGGIWVSSHHDRAWLALSIRTTAKRLCINTWHEAKNAIVDYPWVHALHHQPARRVWDQAFRGC